MEKIMNIYQRINAVMKEVSYIQKEQKMVNGQYRFVSHDAVVAKLQGPLVAHGIVVVPSVVDLKQDGNRTAVTMEITFVNIDDPTDKFSIYQHGYGIDTQDKGVGKAVSYAVKYALLKQFCLETGDDAEKDTVEYVPQEAIISNEIMKKALQERKKLIIELAGKENKESLVTYIEKLKETFKSKKEEELFLAKEAPEFIKDFMVWKEKQSEKVAKAA